MFRHILCTCIEKPRFWHTENEKNYLHKMLEIPMDTMFCHDKIYLCAKYSHIIMNYAIDMSMNMVICLKHNKCSYIIVHFVNFFVQNISKSMFLFFPLTTSKHKRTPCQRIPFFEFPSFSLIFSNRVKTVKETIRR